VADVVTHLDMYGRRLAPEEVPKMRVRVLRGFCLGGGRDAYPGDIVDMDEIGARQYIGTGKVAPVLEAVQVSDEVPANREPSLPNIRADQEENEA